MIIENKKIINNITNKVKRHAKKNYQNSDLEVFLSFIKCYYSQASSEDLINRSTASLYGLVYSHWLLVSEASVNEDVVMRIYNPTIADDLWVSTHTVIQLITKDMPFLVDSIRMEIERMGINNYLMIYTGGIYIHRDDKDAVEEVRFYQPNVDEHADVEAPIHVEIGRQTNRDVLQALEENILNVIADVKSAYSDWQSMADRVKESIESIDKTHNFNEEETAEAKAYLEWLLLDHFTFLGIRDYVVIGTAEKLALELEPASGLGVLKDEKNSKKVRYFSELPEQVQKMMFSSSQIIVLSKTNTLSTVHRAGYTDYIGIKKFDPTGKLIGERRIIGLYTSSAYASNPKNIPFLRHKVDLVLNRSGLPRLSHAGKDLMHILTSLPRDDLFQASPKDLLDLSLGILHLQERRRIRLFVRKDSFDRFMSCIVFIPRDRFSSELIYKMEAILIDAFSGVHSSFTTHFSASILAQIHFVIRVNPKVKLNYDLSSIEQELVAAGESWQNLFIKALTQQFDEEMANELTIKYRNSFHAGYREHFSPNVAVKDMSYIEHLLDEDDLGIHAYPIKSVYSDGIAIKLYRKHKILSLSDTLPTLENMGMRVNSEQLYPVTYANGEQAWINEFDVDYKDNAYVRIDKISDLFRDSFYNIWIGEAEDDLFNTLVLAASLSWRKVSIFRAYAKYLKQIRITFSLTYIAETLIQNSGITTKLMDLFFIKFNPNLSIENRLVEFTKLESRIIKMLDQVVSLDQDRILRKYLNIIQATLRTNYFQLTDENKNKDYISFKLDPKAITQIPLPAPYYEIFVYSPRFEGIHLRFDKVARGGIRWSDRREDFRTEILNLAKAQQVKNAVIVPAGAKGGFVPKNLPLTEGREAVLKEGVACYQGFINGLLDCVDTLRDEKFITPRNTLCYDDTDSYLVVAADKGTATFSDIANEIALSRNYWMGDAFASGGRTGYDHKKMGITARGAWSAARRHFQNLYNTNIDTTEFTVIGIGDMSGDVFGNGMLMSDNIKLVAAFNHQHIFIDPSPDTKVSFSERMRLYNISRSTWADYNSTLISDGGGIIDRSSKRVKVTPEMKDLFSIDDNDIVPDDLIKAILKSEVDMIWNGGIGTFIKSSDEEHVRVGDHANDFIRVNASEVNAKIICEGGNLGLTQLARIEYALNGGQVNTDFIDNSAGVDCSDHEVNIKIALNSAMKSGRISVKRRNDLLRKMTDEVAELVLFDNFEQNRLISQTLYSCNYYMSLYINFINYYERHGLLKRKLYALPDNKVLNKRMKLGEGLSRPEISMLVAISKNIICKELQKTDLLDHEFFHAYIYKAFPKSMWKKYKEDMLNHRLRREIIATQLSNRIVSEMGFAYIFQMRREMSASLENIVCTYIISREIFDFDRIESEINSYDFQVSAQIQYGIMARFISLIRRTSRWFMQKQVRFDDISILIDTYKPTINYLYKRTPKLLQDEELQKYTAYRYELIDSGVNEADAARFSVLPVLFNGLIIVEASLVVSVDMSDLTKCYFQLTQQLQLLWFREYLNAYPAKNRWTASAKSVFKKDLDTALAILTVSVINNTGEVKSVLSRVNAWIEEHSHFIEKWNKLVSDMRSSSDVDFAMITVAINELGKLTNL